MISLCNVVKDFGNARAVDGVSFDVNEGENVVLLGTSGCGKTTTLRMINRLIEASSGSVFIGGKNINTILPETLRRSIGYVLQHCVYDPWRAEDFPGPRWSNIRTMKSIVLHGTHVHSRMIDEDRPIIERADPILVFFGIGRRMI